ncbi:putative AAA family ATPase [Candidatus Termititenax persephonae]|uniref:AAA family ATPase n=1 Tax=Candidatus Termititenax persephonae TaxID=2218525 RepID=A0A388THN2_9BACT|nr:putative AAA family ATPase [Candidatus Termititenax persephonae]
MAVRKRWQEAKIIESLGIMRVTLIVGSRQCGKTTLAKQMAGKDFEYRTLDDSSFLEMAQGDSQEFIKHDKKTMIIDEVQRVPGLILAIKKEVDENPRYGRYLITGSANIQTLPTVKESLAGRVEKIRLRPFAYGEILGNQPLLLARLSRKVFVENKNYDQKKILKIAMDGGFPEPLTKKMAVRRRWHRSYVNTLIEKDLRDIANIKRQAVLKKLFSVTCEFSAKYMDKAAIGSGLAVSRQTLDEYLNILENIYLLDRVPPWLNTGYDRVGKQDKIFVTDTGLLSAVLNWQIQDVKFSGDKKGKLIETFVYNQLAAQIDIGSGANLYHYRDNRGHEVDFIIETKKEIIGLEVKASSGVGAADFKHLKWFRDNICRKKFYGIVLYTGKYVLPFSKDLRAVPLNNLWE